MDHMPIKEMGNDWLETCRVELGHTFFNTIQQRALSFSELDTMLAALILCGELLSLQELLSTIQWWQTQRRSGQAWTSFLCQRGIVGSFVDQVPSFFINPDMGDEQAATLFNYEGIEAIRNGAHARDPEFTCGTEPVLPADELPPAVGDRLGKCLLTQLIGEGSSCLVFEAFHTALHVTTAVKVFTSQDEIHAERFHQQFRSEAQLLAKLDHESIVRVLDYEDSAYPFIVMEFVDGASLEDLIARTGHLKTRQVIQIFTQIARGLAYAHSRGIIHRDIKPANILLDRAGRAKLADLGIAELANVKAKRKRHGTKRYLLGTPAYVAPEQAFEPDSASAAADLYSLGASMYHALSGRTPFQAKSIDQMIMKHVSEAPTMLSKLQPGIPERLVALVQTMLAKQPEMRPESVDAVADELSEINQEHLGLKKSDSMTSTTSVFELVDAFRQSLGGTQE